MGFFDSLSKFLKPVASVASFIPGPHQPFAAAGAAALNAADQIGGGGSQGVVAGDGGGGGFDLGGLGDLAAKYGGPIAGVLSALEGRKLGKEALGVQREGLEFARNRVAETEPLRVLAMNSLLGATPEAPRMSETFVDPTNPFSRPSQELNLSLPGLAETMGQPAGSQAAGTTRAVQPATALPHEGIQGVEGLLEGESIVPIKELRRLQAGR